MYWPDDTIWYHSHHTFTNFSHLHEQKFEHSVFRVLLEAPKIATDLFVIKSSTCRGLVCLLTFL
jgi:hypothetical protein